MPNCKNCGTRISRFDKDICPVCGYRNPLDGVESETVELTMASLELPEGNFKDVHPHKKSIFITLWVLLGFSGIHMFYLRHFRYGFYFLVPSFLFGGALFVTLFLLLAQNLLLSLLIPIGSLYLISLIILFIFIPRLSFFKDGNGNLLK